MLMHSIPEKTQYGKTYRLAVDSLTMDAAIKMCRKQKTFAAVYMSNSGRGDNEELLLLVSYCKALPDVAAMNQDFFGVDHYFKVVYLNIEP